MNEKQFKDFVESELAHFMERFKLYEIQVKDDNGNKGKIRRNKEGLLISDITTTNIL